MINIPVWLCFLTGVLGPIVCNVPRMADVTVVAENAGSNKIEALYTVFGMCIHRFAESKATFRRSQRR